MRRGEGCQEGTGWGNLGFSAAETWAQAVVVVVELVAADWGGLAAEREAAGAAAETGGVTEAAEAGGCTPLRMGPPRTSKTTPDRRKTARFQQKRC